MYMKITWEEYSSIKYIVKILMHYTSVKVLELSKLELQNIKINFE